MNENKTYNITQVSERLGVSVKTLQRWDRDGKLVAKRTPTNRRFYTENQLKELEGDNVMDGFKKIAEKFVEYLKADDFDNAFKFVLNDGFNDFDFGIVYVSEFDTLLFVVSMYGDGSVGDTDKILKFEDQWDRESDDFDDELEYITNFLYENYKEWNPVIDRTLK